MDISPAPTRTLLATNIWSKLAKNLLVLGVLALSQTTVSGQARECVSNVPKAQALLGQVKHMIEIRDVAKIEVFLIPYDWMSPVSVYPELIEQPHNLHPNIPELTEEFLNGLALAIGKTNVKKGNSLPDLRWSLKIHDRTGKFIAIRIGAPYLWRHSRHGLVDDICVNLDGNLFGWLEANFEPFKDCFDKAQSRSETSKCFSR